MILDNRTYYSSRDIYAILQAMGAAGGHDTGTLTIKYSNMLRPEERGERHAWGHPTWKSYGSHRYAHTPDRYSKVVFVVRRERMFEEASVIEQLTASTEGIAIPQDAAKEFFFAIAEAIGGYHHDVWTEKGPFPVRVTSRRRREFRTFEDYLALEAAYIRSLREQNRYEGELSSTKDSARWYTSRVKELTADLRKTEASIPGIELKITRAAAKAAVAKEKMEAYLAENGIELPSNADGSDEDGDSKESS